MDTPQNEKPTEELVSPYCGGCGHNFFHEPKITLTEAREKAKTRRCHYCIEDAIEDAKPKRYTPPPETIWIDPEW